MKITILAAAIAATTAVSSLPADPAFARSQHCFSYDQRICRPTQHGTTICRTTRQRRCVTNFNDMRKKESLQDRFVRRSQKGSLGR